MASLTKKIRHLTEDEKTGIKMAFEFFDSNKDGYLDYYETKAAIRSLGFEMKKSQLLAIMRAYDKIEENKINREDFYYVMADKIAKRDPIDELKYAYKLFSAESTSGKITLVDLRRINKTVGCQLSEEEMRAMIEDFDDDQDGCINEAEFIEIMSETTIQ